MKLVKDKVWEQVSRQVRGQVWNQLDETS